MPPYAINPLRLEALYAQHTPATLTECMALLKRYPPSVWRSLRYIHTNTLRYIRQHRIAVSDNEWVAWATMLNTPTLPSSGRTGQPWEKQSMLPMQIAGFCRLPPKARVILAQAFVEQRPIGMQQSERVFQQLRWLLHRIPHDAIRHWETSPCLDLRATALIATHQPHALVRLWEEELLSQPFNAVFVQGALALEFGLHEVADYFLNASFPQQWEDQRYRIVQDFGILSVWMALLSKLPEKMPQWPRTYIECEMQDTKDEAHQHAWNSSAFNEDERLQLLNETSGVYSAEPLPWKWVMPVSLRTAWLTKALPAITNVDRLRAVFNTVLPEQYQCLELISGTFEEQQTAMIQFCHQSEAPSPLVYPDF